MSTLSAEQFSGILASLRSDRATGDKRQDPRVGFRCKVKIQVLDPNEGLAAYATIPMKDISARGIGLLTNRRIAKDIRFIVSFDRADGGVLRVQYVVVQIRTISADLFVIGGKLVGVLDGKSAKGLKLDPPAAATAAK